MGANTPCPDNGGPTVVAYCQFSPRLRDDLGGASQELTAYRLLLPIAAVLNMWAFYTISGKMSTIPLPEIQNLFKIR